MSLHPADAPVTDQTPVDKGAQECPLQSTEACDVYKLSITATMQDGGEKKTPPTPPSGSKIRKLECTKVLRGSKVSDIEDEHILELLGRYDLLIDTIADYPTNRKPTPDENVKLEAEGKFEPDCVYQSHPLMMLKPLTEADELKETPGGLSVLGTKLEAKIFWANSAWPRLDVNNGLSLIFEVIRSLWPMYNPKLLEVRGEGCGKRGRDAAEAPNQNLVALLRIFRKDFYGIAFKMPPLGTLTHEKAGLITGETSITTTRSSTSGFGGEQQTDTSKVGGDGTTFTHEGSRWSDGEGSQHSISRTRDNDGNLVDTQKHQYSGREGIESKTVNGETTTKLLNELEGGRGFQLVIKRNGLEIGTTPGPGERKSIKEKIEDAIEAVRKTLEALRDLFLKVPQLGWKFSFSFSLLAGSAALEWGPRILATPKANGRYLAVENIFSIKFALDVVDISLTGSFGVRAKVAGTGIEAAVSATIGVKVHLEWEGVLDGEGDEMHEIGLQPALTCEIKAEASASVFGWSIFEGQAAVKAGITLEEGKLVISKARGLHLTGKVKSLKVEITGYVQGPSGPPDPLDEPIQIMRAYDIYEFK